MSPHDVKRLAACLAGASELYGKSVSQAGATLWAAALDGYDIAAIEHAFARHFRDPDVGAFMPKPAERRLLGERLRERQVKDRLAVLKGEHEQQRMMKNDEVAVATKVACLIANDNVAGRIPTFNS